jgi:hypothetical protein
VVVHSVFSVANVAIGPIAGLGTDAQAFHLEAMRFANGQGVSVGLINGWVYSAFIGTIYRVTHGGLLLGQQLSIIATIASSVVMVRIMKLLNVCAGRVKWVLLVVWMLPSEIIFTSATLREAYQQLFLLLAVEYALRSIEHPRIRTLSVMAAAALLGGSLHGAVAIACVAVAATAILISGAARAKNHLRGGSALRIVAPVVMLLVVAVGATAPKLIFPYQLHGGALSAATQYRDGTPLARADYLRFPPGTTIGVADLPLVVGLYEFAPLPWEAQNLSDAVAMFEAALRCVMILTMLVALVHAARRSYRQFLEVLLLAGGWLTMELAWSLGTTNWGTSARHHIVAFPLLAILCTLAPRSRRSDPSSRRLGPPARVASPGSSQASALG